MNDLIFRDSAVTEAASILALWREARTEPSRTDNLEAVTALIEHQPAALIVAEVDERMVGTIIAGWDGWRGNIYRLVVHPDYRRRGIAAGLVQEAIRRLRQQGAHRINLYALDNTTALAFWDSLAELGIERDTGRVRYTVSQ